MVPDFDHIFNDYYRKLYYHAYSFLRNPENARDVVNDAFEILWKNFGRHRDNPQVGAYLYSIVRNRCVDILRRGMLHRRFVSDSDPQFSFREYYDYTDYDMRLEALRNYIESLPAKTKAVFILCRIDGYTYDEAARRLGISVNTAKTLLYRAMRALRDIYSE